MSYATLSAAYMDHICAMDKGYFRDEGLNIEVIRAPGGVATPGLLSGQFQFSSSASSAVSAAVRGGPVKIVYTNLSRPSYSLVSIKSDITSAKDLVGKKIAINSFGDTGHLSTILYLKKMGVNPASVLFIAVGRNEVRFPALCPGPSMLLRWSAGHGRFKGPKTRRTGRSGQRNPTGLERRCHIEQAVGRKPATGRTIPTCLGKGQRVRASLSRRDVALISKRDPTPLDAIKVDYDATKASMTEDGSLPDDVLRDEIATRAELTKAANPPDISAVFDYSIIRKNYAQLKAAGWQPAR